MTDQPYQETPLTSEQVEIIKSQALHEGWPHEDLVMLDVLLNTLAFHWLKFYTPFQTMSSHFQLAANDGDKFSQIMIWLLDKIQTIHGEQAVLGDEARDEASHKIENTEGDA